jgi:hypothetical protein
MFESAFAPKWLNETNFSITYRPATIQFYFIRFEEFLSKTNGFSSQYNTFEHFRMPGSDFPTWTATRSSPGNLEPRSVSPTGSTRTTTTTTTMTTTAMAKSLV